MLLNIILFILGAFVMLLVLALVRTSVISDKDYQILVLRDLVSRFLRGEIDQKYLETQLKEMENWKRIAAIIYNNETVKLIEKNGVETKTQKKRNNKK